VVLWRGINTVKLTLRFNTNKEGGSSMNWIVSRVKEMSSWSGAALIGLGAMIILGGPFVNMLAWAAVIWGIISIVKKD
jgi:hypothetical protein